MNSLNQQVEDNLSETLAIAITRTVEVMKEQVEGDVYGIVVVCDSGLRSLGLAANTRQQLQADVVRWSGNEKVRPASLEFDVTDWAFMDYTHFHELNDRIRELYNMIWEDPSGEAERPEELVEVLLRAVKTAIGVVNLPQLVGGADGADLLLGLQFIEPYQPKEFDAMEKVSLAVNSPGWHARLLSELEIARPSK